MGGRTTDTLVTFTHPFCLAALDEQLPAGTYRVTVDEEEIAGLSFLAHRRLSTSLHVPAIGGAKSGLLQVVAVDADELQAARATDAQLQNRQENQQG